MNILFGGSFDPVHLGHVQLLKGVIEKFNPAKVIILPSSKSIRKGQHFFSWDLRLKLLQIISEEFSKTTKSVVEISDLEFTRNKPFYTFEAILILKPDTLLLGGDLEYTRWKCFSEVIDKSIKSYLIFPRKNYPVYPRNPKEIILDLPQSDISSSEIIARLKNHHSITKLVPASVEDLIKKNFEKLIQAKPAEQRIVSPSEEFLDCDSQSIR